ncbi:Transducin/WD40 repeat-like superfamily protein [Rhynchospora pubera]|uniref:Transducin/WD40 repeat-like superfamily protein n=1 Tax=Rhynchospora pubera TaxID=906938 RepID=A0AAV8EIV4_9POAL|nr:Transducin/WD40 repeat-like superfamily protein [Rhynchospora pubera]
MEQFLLPSSLQRNPSAYKDQIRWTRCIAELEGRLSPKFRHQNSHLLLNSYSQTGTFAHISDDGEANCRTTLDSYTNSELRTYFGPSQGVKAVEFDAKGIYVASVTKSGCLSVHDFETLYCTIHGPSSSTAKCKGTGKPLVHISTSMALNAVKWNPSNQDEVACASRQRDKIFLFDISYVSAEPIEVLEIGRSRFSDIQEGFSDIVFLSEDKSRLLASSLNGGIYMWDRRVSTTHCLEQFTKSSSECQFNSLELDRENRVIFGAGRNGVIYAWDLRGGRSSFAFQSPNEVPVLTSLKVSSMLEKIKDLKEQSNIVSREIHSIKFDPSCPHQLAFHLDDGWSGVINVNDLSVTHVHCPPPNWLDGIITCTIIRRPAWLPTFSVYAVSSSSKAIYLLDFYPDKTSPSHINFNDEIETISRGKRRLLQNKLISLSEDVICCAVHPFNGTIVAGTEESSLMVVSQTGTGGEDGE